MIRYLLLMVIGVSLGCEANPSPFEFEEGPEHITIETRAYLLKINKDPFQIRTLRDGKIVLETTGSNYAQAEFTPGAYLDVQGEWHRVIGLEGAEPCGGRLVINLLTDGEPRNLSYTITPEEYYYKISLDTRGIRVKELGDTYILGSSGHWYGQGELGNVGNILLGIEKTGGQYFPLESGEIERNPLQTQDENNIITPLWLTSQGSGIFVDSYKFLHEQLNVGSNGLFSLKMIEEPYTNPQNTTFEYYVILGQDIVEVYKRWAFTQWENKKAWNKNYPLPPYEAFAAPIFTTWAQYKWNIDQETVLELALQIAENGFPCRIIGIDDRWQRQWGELEFDAQKFPDPVAMINKLHEQGFMVSLWIPPFFQRDTESFSFASGTDPPRENNYFLTSPMHSSYNSTCLIGWWDSLWQPNAGLIDVSDREALTWWSEKLNYLVKQYGVDLFKFDGGEAVWMPTDAIAEERIHPNQYADRYVAWARDNRGYDLRCGWFSQGEGHIVREFDKSSTWGLDNGLHSVLTQALALGMIGYPYVLPDMIGGNEYLHKVDDELMIRWCELNAFLPLMQFSVLPWRDNLGSETGEICLQWTEIHQGLVGYIWRLVKEARETAIPLVRPLFFHNPEDMQTYTINDQFLLGPDYLVCPVFTKGQRERDLYLPEGRWRDLGNGKIYQGPQDIKGYPAPLERIPVFVRE